MTFLDLATTGGCLCRACGVRVATAYEHRFIVFLARHGRRHGTTSGAAGERKKTGTDPCSDGRQPMHRSPWSSVRSACARSVGCSSTAPTMSGTARPLRFRRNRPHRTACLPGARGFLLPHPPPFALFPFRHPDRTVPAPSMRPTGRSGRAAVSGTREHRVAGAALGGGAAPCRRRRVPIVVMISAAAGGRRGRAARPGAVPGPHRFGAATVFHLQPIDSKYISRRRRHHRGTPGVAQAPQASAHFKPSKRFLCTEGQVSRHPWTKSPAICQQPGCLQVNMLIYKG